MSENNSIAQEYTTNHKERFGKKPLWGYYNGSSYDAIYILAEALKKVGEDATALKDYLYNLEDYQGTIGTYGFDENGDVVGIKFADFQVINGKPVEKS